MNANYIKDIVHFLVKIRMVIPNVAEVKIFAEGK